MAPDDIPGGSSYAATIPHAIQNCRVFVVIISEKTQESLWVPKEIDQAINARKIIMPFMIENCSLKDDFNFYLSNVHRYAAYENKANAAKRMVSEICSLLDIEPPKSQEEESDDPSSIAVQSEPTAASAETKSKPVEKPDPGKAVSGETASPGSKKRKRLLFGIIAAFAVAVLGGLILHFSGNGNRSADASDDRYHVILSADSDMGIRDFDANLEILRARLDIFCREQSYQIEPGKDSVDVYLPKSIFNGKDPAEYASYISDPGMLYIGPKDGLPSEYIYLDRSNVDEIALEPGTIPGADIPEEEAFDYIRVTLAPQFLDAYAEQLAEFGDSISIALDVGEGNPFHYYMLSPGLDAGTYCIVDQELLKETALPLTELLYWNMAHDPMAGKFDFQLDLKSAADWQAPEQTEIPGKNQCAFDEVPDPAVTFSLESYSEVSAGELLDLEMIVKNRVDALSCPYAFGMYSFDKGGEDSTTSLVIRVQADRINRAIMSAIGDDRPGIDIGKFSSFGISYEKDSIQVSDDGMSLTVQSNDPEMFLRALETTDGDLYLRTYSGKLLWAGRDQVQEDGSVVFHDVCIRGEQGYYGRPIDESSAWLLPFLHTALTDSDETVFLDLDSVVFDDGADESMLAFAPEADDSALLEQIKKLSVNVEADVNDTRLSVSLHLPVNESLPQQGTELAKQIYQLADPEHSAIDYIAIYLIDEDDSTRERARIFFDVKKGIWTDDGWQNGFIYNYGIFAYGRLEPLQDAFREIVETDAFFVQKTRTDSSSGFSYSF